MEVSGLQCRFPKYILCILFKSIHKNFKSLECMFCKFCKMFCVIISESHLLSLNCITYYILAFYRPPHNSWPPPEPLLGWVHEWSSKERTHFCWVDDIWEHLYPGLSPSRKWHRGFLHCFLLYKSVVFISVSKTCIFTEGFRRFSALGNYWPISKVQHWLFYHIGRRFIRSNLFWGFPKLAKYLCLYFMFWILSTPHLFPSLHTCIHKHILLSNRTLF